MACERYLEGMQHPIFISKVTNITLQLNQRRNALQTAYAAQWNAANIDAILCPVNPSTASAHGESKYWGYSSAFNLLDYSAGVIPVGQVESTDTWESYPRASNVDLSVEDSLFKSVYTGPEKYRSAPVNLQIVTRRYTSEKTLLVMEEVVKALGEGDENGHSL